MANTICLSTDMQTLYLVAGGNVSSFPLAGNGVKINLDRGNITATGATAPVLGLQTTFSTARGQWTVFFDDTAVALEIIGIIDMEVHRASYPLSGNQSVNLKITATDIVVTQ